MAGNAVNASSINQALINQANVLGATYEGAKRFLIEWQVNVPNAAAMTAAGFTDPNDQAQLAQWMQDLQAFISFMEGTQQGSNTHQLVADVARLKGVGL